MKNKELKNQEDFEFTDFSNWFESMDPYEDETEMKGTPSNIGTMETPISTGKMGTSGNTKKKGTPSNNGTTETPISTGKTGLLGNTGKSGILDTTYNRKDLVPKTYKLPLVLVNAVERVAYWQRKEKQTVIAECISKYLQTVPSEDLKPIRDEK